MSRLLARDTGPRSADPSKAQVQKYFPPDMLIFAVTRVDYPSLRKVKESCRKLLRDVRSGRALPLDRLLKLASRRLNNVLRSGAGAIQDVRDLANDTDKAVNPAEQTAAANRFKTYLADSDALQSCSARLVRVLRAQYPQFKDQQFRRILRQFLRRALDVDRMLGRLGLLLKKIQQQGSGAGDATA